MAAKRALRVRTLFPRPSSRGVKISELRAARVDILVGMLFSNVVMFFIILVTGAVLHAHGKTAFRPQTRRPPRWRHFWVPSRRSHSR